MGFTCLSLTVVRTGPQKTGIMNTSDFTLLGLTQTFFFALSYLELAVEAAQIIKSRDAGETAILLAKLRQLRDARGFGPSESRQPTPVESGKQSTRKRSTEKRKPATVNQLMAGTIAKIPETIGWNSKKWAEQLNCTKSTVVETATWKRLELVRLQTKAKRKKDRPGDENAEDEADGLPEWESSEIESHDVGEQSNCARFIE